MLKKIKGLLLENKTASQTVAKNTFWLTVSNVGGRLLRAVIIIYSARVLGASDWGIFSYAVSLVAFITVFTDIGISPMLVRETAKSREDPKTRTQIISTSFLIRAALLAVGILVVIFGAPHFTTIAGVRVILPIVTFILIFDTFRDFGFSIVRAMEKMEWEAVLFLFTNLAIVVFGFVFLYLSKTVTALTYSYALGTGIGTAATIFALRKDFKGVFSNFSFPFAKYLISSAWPFAIAAILGVLMINTDILIIGWLRSAEDVGLNSAAQRIVQLLYLLPAILSTSLLPSFARLAAKKDNEKLRGALEKILGALFLAAIPMVVGGVVLGKEIMNLLFGAGYAGGTPSFQILLVTILIDFPAGVLSTMIFAYNRQKNITIYSAIGGVSNALLDLALIPTFGITGSAIATLAAQFFSNAYLRHVAKKINGFKILPYLRRTFLAAAVMLALVLTLKALGVNVILNIAAAAVLYFGLLFVLKEPLLREIKLILQPAALAAPKNDEPVAL